MDEGHVLIHQLLHCFMPRQCQPGSSQWRAHVLYLLSLSSLIAQHDVDEHEVVRSPQQASVSSSFKTAEGCAVKDKRVSAKIRLCTQKPESNYLS